jgi:hypothetical protein
MESGPSRPSAKNRATWMSSGATVASSVSSAVPRSRFVACACLVSSRTVARCSASSSSRGVRSRFAAPARLPLAFAAARSRSCSTVRLIACLASCRYSGRSVMIGVLRSSSIRTPAARA